MKLTYYAIIYKYKGDSDYSVSFPEIPYGATQGTDIENTMFMAKDYLATYFDDGYEGEIPKSQNPEKLLHDFKTEYKSDLESNKIDMVSINPVSVYVKEKTKRLNITIPESLFNELNAKVGKGKKASFISNLIEKELGTIL